MSKSRTITLTGRAPVSIREDQWPEIATGSYDWCDKPECKAEANRRIKIQIRVRQHADGRALVHGAYDYDTLFRGEPDESHRRGVLLESGADIPQAITEVGEQMIAALAAENGNVRHIRNLVAECIADLPAVKL